MARSTRCFGGKTSVTIPAGAPALSDPVVLTVPAMSDLAVSLYLPGTVPISTLHDVGLQTSYVSSPGDFDHLHPNDLGYQAMANAVPLALFSPASAATSGQLAETASGH